MVVENYKFKKLNVWQSSIKYVSSIYQLTTRFPKEEKFGLADQLRRAAVSIPLNIAEGTGAGSDLEFIRFLRTAQRSAYEVITGLEIAANLNMADKISLQRAIQGVDQLSAMLGALMKSLKTNS